MTLAGRFILFLISLSISVTGYSEEIAEEIDLKTTISPSSEDDAPYSPAFTVSPKSPRYRYRLAGLETNWTEGVDEMNLVIRFIRNTGDDIERFSFNASGVSRRWHQKNSSRHFVSREEVIPIPPGTEALQVIMTSSGSPAAVGIFTIQDLTLTATGNDSSQILLENGMAPDWSTSRWNKSGTRPSMALDNPDSPENSRAVSPKRSGC